MWTRLDQLLQHKDFLPFQKGDESPVQAYYKIENPIVYVVIALPVRYYLEEKETFEARTRRLEERLFAQLPGVYCTRLIRLRILFDLSTDPVENLPGDFVDNLAEESDESLHRLSWYLREDGYLAAPQGQPTQLAGIEKLCRQALLGEAMQEKPLVKAASREAKPVFTYVFLALFLAVFLWITASGRQEEGAFYFGFSVANLLRGRLYCILTSAFLHANLRHLLMNSVYFYYFGVRLEKFLGRGRFLLLCLVGCLGTALLSALFEQETYSIGSSGVVFAFIGGMLYLTYKEGAGDSGMNYSTLLAFALVMLFAGLFDPEVNNWGHVGGFLGGILFFAVALSGRKGRGLPKEGA